MNWLEQLAASQPIAHSVLVLCAGSTLGLALGGISYRGIRLGTTGVLFAGLLLGHFGARIDPRLHEFLREFGLILFVFMIGLQLGPGFFASLRHGGLRMNILASSVVVSGALIAALVGWMLRQDVAATAGLLSGATTNTPSLGAAQQTMALRNGSASGPASSPGAPPAANAALAYAVGYPIGILSVFGALLSIRALFRIDPVAEARAFHEEQRRGVEPLERLTLKVENRNLDGLTLEQLPGRRETSVVISRIRHVNDPTVHTASLETVVHCGDILVAVGSHTNLTQFCRIVGSASDVDLLKAAGAPGFQRVVVTRKEVLGKTVRELGLDHLYGVAVTRVLRGDIEMTALPEMRLQFGDRLHLVGSPDGLAKVSTALGNSVRAINETHFGAIFLGIAIGVLAGLVPIQFPGLPIPLRLGLAGGPLLVAILLSRWGHAGPLVWHVPVNTSLAFRELGITVFLACVGLHAGEGFFQTVFSREGLTWLLGALLIALPPLIIVGVLARLWLKLNYTVLGGLLAGSMTDPPALAFASVLSGSDAPAMAYATVYPFTMLLRIVSAQVLVILLSA